MSQGDIRASLDRVLSNGLPVSLYQLPQITGTRWRPTPCRGWPSGIRTS